VGRSSALAVLTVEEEQLALVRRSREELFNWIETALLSAGPNPVRGVEAGLGALLDWVAAEPAGARALLLEAPEPAVTARELQRTAFTDAVALLQRALPPDPTRPSCVEQVVVGAVVSILRTLLLADDQSRAPELREGIARFVLYSFGQEIRS
jgi:hypothetical protein